MHEIESWIETAASTQNIAIKKLLTADAQNVMRETMARYVRNDARSLVLVDGYYTASR
jgi:hypothetical protein